MAGAVSANVSLTGMHDSATFFNVKCEILKFEIDFLTFVAIETISTLMRLLWGCECEKAGRAEGSEIFVILERI